MLSGVWKLNYFTDAKPVVKALFNDWPVSAIVAVQSGAALTVTAGQDRNLDGIGNDRADLVGDPSLPGGRPRDEAIEGWFNTAAFTNPALGTDGNSGRGVLDGPGYRNVDLGIFRDFGLPGRSMIQLRMETTNAFNFVNLQNPGTSLAAPATFGKIRSARDMRRIQLGARLSF